MSFFKNPYKTLLLMFIQAVAVLLSQEFTVLRAFHPSVHLEWSPSRSTFFSPVLPKLPTVKDVLSFNHHRLIVLSTIKRITGKLNGKNKDIRIQAPLFLLDSTDTSTVSNCCEFSECSLLVSGRLSSGLVASAQRQVLVHGPDFE